MDMAPAVAVAGTFLGILFVYSGAAKAVAFNKFATDLLLLPYMPYRFARPAAGAVLSVEIVAGALAIVGQVWAQATLVVLLTLFSVVAFVARSTNQKIPCNCFGAHEQEYLSLGTVVRNVGLAAVAVVCMVAEGESTTWLSAVHGLALFLLFRAVIAVARNHKRSAVLRGETS